MLSTAEFSLDGGQEARGGNVCRFSHSYCHGHTYDEGPICMLFAPMLGCLWPECVTPIIPGWRSAVSPSISGDI